MAAKKDLILLDTQGEIAIITLNIPHKLNALSGDLYRQLAYLLRKVASMDQIVITVLTGNGRFFSAGADVASINGNAESSEDSPRTFWLRNFAANNLELTKAFISHPKLLVAALNGPAVGLSAAIIGHCDFIYATSSTFILTPFTSLGLVAEGGSSFTFARRLGLSKANEALILSKPIHAEELLACGFLNKIYPTPDDPNDTTGFHKQVLQDIQKEFLDRGLNRESMLGVKKLVKASWNAPLEDANVKEVFDGLERFLAGAPQKEFAAIKSGAKKHKL